jgi:hypothetical protein
MGAGGIAKESEVTVPRRLDHATSLIVLACTRQGLQSVGADSGGLGMGNPSFSLNQPRATR